MGAETTLVKNDTISIGLWSDGNPPSVPDPDPAVDAEFGYIPELVNELAMNLAPKVIAQIGVTPGTLVNDGDFAEMTFAVDESAAGSGVYSTTIYFDLRGN